MEGFGVDWSCGNFCLLKIRRHEVPRKCWSKMIESLKNTQKNPSSNTVYGWNSDLLLVLSMFILSFTVQCLMNLHNFSPPCKNNFPGFSFPPAAFLLGGFFPKSQKPRAIIVQPTRELALQTIKVVRKFPVRSVVTWVFPTRIKTYLKKRCDRKVLRF